MLQAVFKAQVQPAALYSAEGQHAWHVLQATLSQHPPSAETVMASSTGADAAHRSADAHRAELVQQLHGMVWTQALQRMYCLVSRCVLGSLFGIDLLRAVVSKRRVCKSKQPAVLCCTRPQTHICWSVLL